MKHIISWASPCPGSRDLAGYCQVLPQIRTVCHHEQQRQQVDSLGAGHSRWREGPMASRPVSDSGEVIRAEMVRDGVSGSVPTYRVGQDQGRYQG